MIDKDACVTPASSKPVSSRSGRLLLIAALGALAAACSTTREAAPVSGASSGAPRPVAGLDWFYHPDADEAKLLYGVETSDDLRLGLACRKGAGRLEITTNAPHGMREIHLESGGETERFRAQGEASALTDGDFLTADAATSAPVFQRFRRVGWLAQWQGARRETYVPHPASVPDIERFFAFCG